MRRILVIDEDFELVAKIDRATRGDFEVVHESNRMSALERVPLESPEIIFVSLSLFGKNGLVASDIKASFEEFRQSLGAIPTILVATIETVAIAVELVELGASGFLLNVAEEAEIALKVESILDIRRRQAELEYLRGQYLKSDSDPTTLSKESVMTPILQNAADVAPTRSTVLLLGETGVGKGYFAKHIHQQSTRKAAHFIHVHCGAIPDSLVESELFGHEKGAFTGAVRRKLGKFELASKGTIFLDEISTLPLPAQIKLLQVLQDGIIQRVGSEQDIRVDVRVIVATNDSLERMVEEGKFRKDLFYRINVFPITIPPLRDRLDEIPSLIDSTIEKLNGLYRKGIKGIQPEALASLKRYAWPGNVRELENVIERAYILERGNFISAESLTKDIMQSEPEMAVLPINAHLSLSEARSRVVDNFERQYLKEALFQNDGKINETAKIAGVGVRQLHKLMKKYGLRKEDFHRHG